MTTSFRDAYGVLQRHAETLRDQREPNIDDLLNIVTESVEAYRVCKARIDAVEVALKAALDGVDAQSPPVAVSTGSEGPVSRRAAVTERAPRAPAPSPSGGAFDDDIPF